jgi:predicted enzyme related to lactoylglutathione lyase
MPKITRHPEGTFAWIELATSDQNAAKDFYCSLFGWAVRDHPMGPEGIYSMFQIEGADVAAAYTLRADQKEHGVQPHWLLYISVGDADEIAKEAAELGGTIYAPPFDVADYGRMAVIADPTGATFAIWQAKSHFGTGATGENGTLCWADLQTTERDQARAFYSQLFGWEFSEEGHDPSGYLHIRKGEHFIGGVAPVERASTSGPPAWLAYFLTSDCRTTTAKAESLGARTILAPLAINGAGMMSILADPQEAVFATFQSTR